METAAGVAEGVLSVCGIVSFADAVDLGGDVVACFEGGGGAGRSKTVPTNSSLRITVHGTSLR